ncbi:MAG: aminomethyl-transferring glycine dehydrogenase [Bacteroidales bacterium]|nr:aminomethyl-transferring glycine dehydrogenase [Bacteroidales bacterium]
MNSDHFAYRHTGPRTTDLQGMLKKIGVESLDELIEKTIPASIRLNAFPVIPEGISEQEYLDRIRKIAKRNKIFKTYTGMGYYGTFMPPVIQRNILENPGWYTSYTPYQAEISQGRLEALLNFQTVITGLTGMELANASLLDEGTAAAEAMIMLYNARSKEKLAKGSKSFFIDLNIFPQTLAVIKTRAEALKIEIVTGDFTTMNPEENYFGALVQYPAGDGKIVDYVKFAERLHARGIALAVIADVMSLVMLKPPGNWGADVVVGSTQRFGIPMGYGGPHAAYFSAKSEYRRFIPGRIIGVTIDRENRRAYRMALQTREQHIKREKATSNICTSQALLAIMAGMYAVYHGYEGLQSIARRIHTYAVTLSDMLTKLGYQQDNKVFFDTLRVPLPGYVPQDMIRSLALDHGINFRYFNDRSVGISLDETTTIADLNGIIEVFAQASGQDVRKIKDAFQSVQDITRSDQTVKIDEQFLRTDRYMDLPLFKNYRSETGMMRYMKQLERKDFALTDGMISLGSCTMKLTGAVEMLPLSWPEFGNIHPFVPVDQAEGYQQIIRELGDFLKAITGFNGVSFQPNSGAAGEYTGLLVIKKYLASLGQSHRDVVLIPASAHGTNPASAAMAGLNVVVVNCDDHGNIDVSDLKAKAELHRDCLAAFMVTYPSTHGVFEEAIREMVDIIHQHGGQVYMDGANMNAQIGLTSPAFIGADICHLNLHKTFAIPHGGGGPGMGPILAANHLEKFLPAHPVVDTGTSGGISAVSSAPFGSASILVISHAYCSLMGGEGLTHASRIAILNANYLASCLNDYYNVLYKGANGFVGHEMILDCRAFKNLAGITEADIAKRLMDYGFHAPTLSFPVHGTLMVEPTESESLQELNRFIEAMKAIWQEIQEVIESGNTDNNVLKNAPHTETMIASDEWKHSYTRTKAAFPLKWLEEHKFWPSVSRVDEAYGDRNLVCSCTPPEPET